MCLLSDEDLAGARRLLQPRGHVDGVAGDQAVAACLVTGHDPSRVQARPRLDRHAEVALELRVQEFELGAHIDRGTNRTERIVLVALRDAEDRHHGIADELLDGRAVAFENVPRRVEEPAQDVAERLGVQAIAERRRAAYVGEQDGDDLATLAPGLGRRRLGGGLELPRFRWRDVRIVLKDRGL